MTKNKLRLRANYIKLLRGTGFRSWTRANERRGELVTRSVLGATPPTMEESTELVVLQNLAEAYVRYVTNDSMREYLRRMEHKIKTRGLLP